MLKTVFRNNFSKKYFSKFAKFDFEDSLNLKSLLKEEELMVA
jgi:hypothetical protein